MKSVAFHTLGCRANQYDTAALESLVRKNQLVIVPFDAAADIYVMNTCAITHQAEKEAHMLLSRVRRQNPQAAVIVTGCSAQVSREAWTKTEGVHYVVGNLEKEKIVEIILRGEDRGSDKNSDTFFAGGVPLPGHSRAFLKIQDGCSQFCSFCIVPFARGLNRSISPERILDSLLELAGQGIKEVVVTGIHLGTYGKDLRPQTSLFHLLQRIDHEKPVPRIRLSSLDPEELSDELIDLIASSDIFCRHLHLPLQSGDDGVLKMMRRRYTAAYFEKLADRLVNRMPDLCLGTDVIVGFPGEDEAAFQNTYRLLEKSPVSYIHTFPYSIREGTKAATFSNHVEPRIKKERARLVRTLSGKKRVNFHESFKGKDLELIREDRKGYDSGLSRNYISVMLDTPGRPKDLLTARIISVTSKEVRGIVLNA